VRFSDWEQVAPDTVIMKDGEPGDYFCFLAEGEMKIAKRGRILGILTPGDCFGEMAVIGKSNCTRVADVVALTEAKLVRITAGSLRSSSEACRVHFYQSFLAVLSERLTSANTRLVSF